MNAKQIKWKIVRIFVVLGEKKKEKKEGRVEAKRIGGGCISCTAQ